VTKGKCTVIRLVPPPPVSLNNASCSSRSLFSQLAAPSPPSANGGPDALQTSVVARKTRTAWLHHSSASSSTILVRSRPRSGPGAFWPFLRRLPRGLLLASPLRAVLEQVFSGLYAVLTPEKIESAYMSNLGAIAGRKRKKKQS